MTVGPQKNLWLSDQKRGKKWVMHIHLAWLKYQLSTNYVYVYTHEFGGNIQNTIPVSALLIGLTLCLISPASFFDPCWRQMEDNLISSLLSLFLTAFLVETYQNCFYNCYIQKISQLIVDCHSGSACTTVLVPNELLDIASCSHDIKIPVET